MDLPVLFARAKQLALRGRGDVEPNPVVGALALRDGAVVGEGWHAFYGGAHAEEAALEAAVTRGREPDTLLVTLEPCSSDGPEKKRPPCTRLLVEAGLRRVVVAALDPDPRHAGRGLGELRAAGIEVIGPTGDADCDGLLDRFRAGLALERPWVVAKWAMSLDGKTATRTGSSRWISSGAALDWAHEQRAHSDAVAVGIGTVLADDPELTVRRVSGETPLRVVVDPEAELPHAARVLATASQGPVVVCVAALAATPRLEALRAAGAAIVSVPSASAGPSGRARVELGPMLVELRRRGVRRLLVEGGGGLLGQLVEQGCVDQVRAVVAPKLVGGSLAVSPIEGRGIDLMEDAVRLVDCENRQLDDCWLIGGFVDRT